jgi:hypothetical protein
VKIPEWEEIKMTRQRLLMKQLLTTGVAVTATLTLSAPVLAEDADGIDMVDGPQCDVVFAVNDKGLNDSQIVFMGGDGTGVTALGVEYPGHDIEAMDIDANNVLYGASGDDVTNGKPGFLYKINKQTAALTDIGKLCVDEADGISFNLMDNTLWGWGQDQGLFHITRGADGELDLSTCQIVLTGPDELEDLTWDNEGDTLYAVGNVFDGDHDASNDNNKARVIVAYTPATGDIQQICRAEMEPITSEIEGMEMQPDGTLMFTYHNEHRVSIYGYIDPNTCELYTGVDEPNPTKFSDIEALACCVDKGVDLPWTYQQDAVVDQTGSTKLEIYGMAVKIDDGVMTVAINANMDASAATRSAHKKARDGYVGFSDMVFDFSGTKYAVKFAEGTNSGVTSTGLYAGVTLKDVTLENYGYKSFKQYATYSPRSNLGALSTHNDYFSWDAKRSVPMSIKTGTKVGDITALSAAQLLTAGLDFSSNLDNAGGTYTFGFSFQMTAEMIADVKKGDSDNLIYFFTECINDGMAIKIEVPPSC